jgi:putative DNA primase/helicase
VSQAALSKAINWATYLRSHAKKVYASATNPAAFSANALADKVRTKKLVDGFTAREVMRHGWQYLTSVEDVREALEWLTDCGWLRCVEKPQSAGGRPTTTYLINPKIYAVRREARGFVSSVSAPPIRIYA